MRKVIVSMNITLDGFMAGPDQGLEWHFRYWNDEMAEESAIQLAQADTILLGRKTYEAMAGYWPLQRVNPAFPRNDLAFAEMMNRHRKIVFSTTLMRLHWSNSMLVRKDIEAKVASLKMQEGPNILIYGSGSIVGQLMRSGQIDEYRVWVHPVVLGSGKPFLINPKDRSAPELFNEKKFTSGVVLFFYGSDCCE
ncbi:MAG: dihydrofolate reductase [Chitinophagaceae bacterium]|nr:dihydrofolate reductase [Chitinophagaceae bacterium]